METIHVYLGFWDFVFFRYRIKRNILIKIHQRLTNELFHWEKSNLSLLDFVFALRSPNNIHAGLMKFSKNLNGNEVIEFTCLNRFFHSSFQMQRFNFKLSYNDKNRLRNENLFFSFSLGKIIK